MRLHDQDVEVGEEVSDGMHIAVLMTRHLRLDRREPLAVIPATEACVAYFDRCRRSMPVARSSSTSHGWVIQHLLHACRQIVERFETQTHSQQPEAVVHVEALPLSRTFTVSPPAHRPDFAAGKGRRRRRRRRKRCRRRWRRSTSLVDAPADKPDS